MNFQFLKMRRATRSEAIIERGMDAMMDAVENGGDRRSLFSRMAQEETQKSNTRTRVTVVEDGR
jgi:hypothetical protein